MNGASVPASVLLAFRATNTRSFRDEIELSLLGTRMSEPGVPRSVAWNLTGATVNVLPVAAVYGANASGKTNVLRAMNDMRQLVLRSFSSGDASTLLPFRPFRLDPTTTGSPTSFEVELVLDDVRHEYGFRFDAERVIEEWAYRWPRGRRSLIFHRHNDDVETPGGSRTEGRAVQRILRSNALVLSTAAAIGHSTLTELHGWFRRNLRFAEERTRPVRQLRTVELLQDPNRRDDVIALLRAADLGVSDAQVRKVDPELAKRIRKAALIIAGQEDESDGPENDPSAILKSVQLLHRGPSGPVAFDADEESLGTLIWLGLLGVVVDALLDGAVLLADELDASLHPGLVRQLVRLFQSPVTNPNRAQLVVNLHDISLISSDQGQPLIGRDQCWFTEKLNDGRTRLFSLADQAPRKGEAIAARYLAGRYGGAPILSDAEFDVALERLLEPEPGR